MQEHKSVLNIDKSNRQLTRKEKILSGLIHSFIFGWIKTWTPEKLKDWIEKNLYPNISQLYLQFSKLPMFTRIQNGIRNYYNQNQQKVLEYFSYEELLWQVEEHRPDLKDVALSEKGRKWFEQLIIIIRNIFLKDIAGVQWWK